MSIYAFFYKFIINLLNSMYKIMITIIFLITSIVYYMGNGGEVYMAGP